MNALEKGFDYGDAIRSDGMYQSNKKQNPSSELVTLLKSVQCELSSLRTDVNALLIHEGEGLWRLRGKNLTQMLREVTNRRVIYVKDVQRTKRQTVNIVLNAREKAIFQRGVRQVVVRKTREV